MVKRRWRIIDEERPFGFAWLAGQAVKERTLFLDISVAALLLSVLSLAPPLMLIDRVLANQSMSTLKVPGGALVLIAAFDTIFGYLRRYLTEVATTRIDDASTRGGPVLNVARGSSFICRPTRIASRPALGSLSTACPRPAGSGRRRSRTIAVWLLQASVVLRSTSAMASQSSTASQSARGSADFIKRPLIFSLNTLARNPTESRITFLECGGNRLALYQQNPVDGTAKRSKV